ncbi:MAG: hypothetical protein HGA53_10560, partial [Anaerolineaceae bacterium]|nr:hypothetical protein [Anaerolineaceae bacterium]
MELLEHLKKLDASGKPIRVGLVGCGQMGSGMVHVTTKMPGMVTAAIADIDPKRALDTYRSVGIPQSEIVVSPSAGEAEDAIAKGKFIVTDDALLLTRLENLNGVVEATGNTEIGAKVAWNCILNQKNIVMLNVETDVTVGYFLSRMAKKTGSIYTVAAGDEPA